MVEALADRTPESQTSCPPASEKSWPSRSVPEDAIVLRCLDDSQRGLQLTTGSR